METKQASFQFHGNLNHFLPLNERYQSLASTFNGRQSIKHLIESLGVPHPELGRLIVRGEQVSLTYLVKDGDQVDVYPLTPEEVIARCGDPPDFVLDNHLGRLARYLRMLGFNCLYRNDYQDEALAQVSSQEGRVLLTRDVRLLMRSQVELGYWVRAKQPRKQIVEIVARFSLKAHVQPFRHCMHCNGTLEPIPKDQVLDRLEPLTKRHYHDFRVCQQCGRIYWAGSHYTRMQHFIQEILDADAMDGA